MFDFVSLCVIFSRLLDRLENIKNNAKGNGVTTCLLCNEKFGKITSSPMKCNICEKVGLGTSESSGIHKLGSGIHNLGSRIRNFGSRIRMPESMESCSTAGRARCVLKRKMFVFCFQAACAKCGVDTTSSRNVPIWLCKLCNEQREVQNNYSFYCHFLKH